MKLIFIFLVSCLMITKVSLSQVCDDVTITTTRLVTLPECTKDNGSIIFTNTIGGTAPYSYELDSMKNLFGSFLDLPLGVYDAKITDALGCTLSFTVNLTYKNIDNIIKPFNAFSPNDDGINDTWVIPGIESFQASQVKVFNRYGQQIYQNSAYRNTDGWNGTQNGNKLPPATYFYVISTINTCFEEYLKGTVTIVR